VTPIKSGTAARLGLRKPTPLRAVIEASEEMRESYGRLMRSLGTDYESAVAGYLTLRQQLLDAGVLVNVHRP
jgi:hypothetical protein